MPLTLEVMNNSVVRRHSVCCKGSQATHTGLHADIKKCKHNPMIIFFPFNIKPFILTLPLSNSTGDSYILDIDKWAPFSKPDDSSLAEENGLDYKIGVTAK